MQKGLRVIIASLNRRSKHISLAKSLRANSFTGKPRLLFPHTLRFITQFVRTFFTKASQASTNEAMKLSFGEMASCVRMKGSAAGSIYADI